MHNSYLETSSRIQSAITEGVAPSAAASCNTFVVEDSVLGADGIAASIKWSTEIVYYQGAPTLILSNLRSEDAPLSTGGTASGPCSFALIYDRIVDVMRRPTKKNSVAVAFLDADHPDILKWISYEFKGQLTRLYTGVILREGVKYPTTTLKAIAEAYNSWGISYICKISQCKETGKWLYPNVCTEIRQVHKGQCILGAIKLHELPVIQPSQYAYDLAVWTSVFAESMADMCDYLSLSQDNAERHPDLFYYERQIGLGFAGFANALGKAGATYEGLAKYLPIIRAVDRSKEDRNLDHVLRRLTLSIGETPDPSLVFLTALVSGIKAGSEVAIDRNMRRVWTQQPTTHTSLRMKDGELSVAPEIQPPYAVRGSDGLSRSRQVSAMRGDNELTYPAYVETRDDVPYETYRQVACLIQHLFNITNMAHTLSHCYYGEEFGLPELKTFILSPLGSLYYRLPTTPAATYSKDQIPDDVGSLNDVDLDQDGFLAMLGGATTDPNPSATCSLVPGECESCSM